MGLLNCFFVLLLLTVHPYFCVSNNYLLDIKLGQLFCRECVWKELFWISVLHVRGNNCDFNGIRKVFFCYFGLWVKFDRIILIVEVDMIFWTSKLCKICFTQLLEWSYFVCYFWSNFCSILSVSRHFLNVLRE